MSETFGGVAYKSHDGIKNPQVNIGAERVRGHIIPFTLGHLASQLVELGEIAPNVSAVCEYFGVSAEEFRDARIYSGQGEVENFIRTQALLKSDAVWDELRPSFDRHMAHIGAELRPYRIPENEQTTREAEVDHLVAMAEEHMDEESPDSRRNLLLLRMRRSATKTGLAVPMNAMLGAALSYEGDSPLTTESIIDAAGDIIFEVNRLGPEDLILSEITLGQWEIDPFMNGLYFGFKAHCYRQGQAKAEALEDLIYKH